MENVLALQDLETADSVESDFTAYSGLSALECMDGYSGLSIVLCG